MSASDDDSFSIVSRWLGALLFSAPAGFLLAGVLIAIGPAITSANILAFVVYPFVMFFWTPLFAVVVVPASVGYAVLSEVVHQTLRAKGIAIYVLLAGALGGAIGWAMHRLDLMSYWTCTDFRPCLKWGWESYDEWARSCLDGARQSECGYTAYASDLPQYLSAIGQGVGLAALVGAIFWLIRRPHHDNDLLKIDPLTRRQANLPKQSP